MDTNNTVSQANAILDYMSKGNTITGIEALNLFGCFRLPARIADLKKVGHQIKSEMVKLNNGKRVAQYTLLEPALF
jgi:hypothetical protein